MDTSEVLQLIARICADYQCEGFLVGGAIRDSFTNNKIRDFDIVVNKRVLEIARCFTEKKQGRLVKLDEKRDTYRVVIEDTFVDFTLLQGTELEEDLYSRDFTINALGVNLKDINKDCKGRLLLDKNIIIDPLGGLSDLKRGVLRNVTGSIFLDDPLRLWRAFRFKAEYDFDFCSPLRELLKRDVVLCTVPAPERINFELSRIFKTSRASIIIKEMEDKYLMLSRLIPPVEEMKNTGQNKYHIEDTWTHSLLVLKKIEGLLRKQYYNKLIPQEKHHLLKVAALFHDIGKIGTRKVIEGEVHYYNHEGKSVELLTDILRELRFSNQEIRYITRVIRYHMRPGYLYRADKVTEKAFYRFFKAAGNETLSVLLHSLADISSTQEINGHPEEIPVFNNYIQKLIQKYLEYRKRDKPLLNGRDLLKYFSINEGPLVGKLLDRVEEAWFSGQVNDREEALNYVQGLIERGEVR